MPTAAHVHRDRLTESETADVLAQRLVATIGTINPDGSGHLAYVLFEHHDGLLVRLAHTVHRGQVLSARASDTVTVRVDS